MEKFYQTILTYISKRPTLKKIILIIVKYSPYITMAIYPCILIYLLIIQSPLLLQVLYKPFGAFIVVTIIRKLVNRKRPYETLNIEPLVAHKKGESFPSRHAVSSMIIGLVCFYVHPILGIFGVTVATIVCLSRIIAGVHYISDVLVAIAIAIIFYII
ncbi:MAG: phosphatase PAP2 family protein [Coprobacillus sp.]